RPKARQSKLSICSRFAPAERGVAASETRTIGRISYISGKTRGSCRSGSDREQLLQRIAQRPGVEIADDFPLAHERDLALLLRPDSDDGVGLLGEAEGGGVPRAGRLRDVRVSGER